LKKRKCSQCRFAPLCLTGNRVFFFWCEHCGKFEYKLRRDPLVPGRSYWRDMYRRCLDTSGWGSWALGCRYGYALRKCQECRGLTEAGDSLMKPEILPHAVLSNMQDRIIAALGVPREFIEPSFVMMPADKR